jgi:bacterioferritin
LTELMKLNVGASVKEQLASDLQLEISAVAAYNRFVKISREEGDNASAELFERLLKDEERHVDWLEAQMHLIEEIGYERYLSQQMREGA